MVWQMQSIPMDLTMKNFFKLATFKKNKIVLEPLSLCYLKWGEENNK